MAQFDYTKYLKQGGVEKYLMEANFGNDLQSRYDYIRPLMSRLPDSARTETFIDGMEDGLREDDKELFDYYFVEAMKALGLEQELMEPEDAMSEPDYEDYAPDSALGPNPSFVEEGESLINPEAEEIDDDDLAAAADYYDSLDENDKILDEFLEMPAPEEDGAEVEVLDDVEELEIEKEQEVTININLEEGDIQVGDLVYFKGHEDKVPMEVLKVRRMFGSNLDAITTEKGEYDETQLVRAKRAVDMGDGTFQVSELEGEVQTEEVSLKPGMVQKGNIVDAIKLLNHIQYEYADAFSEDSMDKVSDVIVMLNQVMKQQ
jgi:hypothetical protein